MIGSTVNALTILVPVLTAALVMLASVVTAITCNAENRILTSSTPRARPDMFTPLAAELKFSKPLDAPLKLRLCFNLSIKDILP